MSQNYNKVIFFSKGIPGFEEERSFQFLLEEDLPLAELNSVNNKDIKFIVVRPQFFFPDYLPEVDLSAEEVELLDVDSSDKVDVWAIMTMCLSNMADSTVNLRAPLLVNSRTGKGLQIILSEEGYSSRERLFADSRQNDAAEGGREGAVG